MKYKDRNYLYFGTSGGITMGENKVYFDSHRYELISVSDFLALGDTQGTREFEIGDKVYLKKTSKHFGIGDYNPDSESIVGIVRDTNSDASLTWIDWPTVPCTIIYVSTDLGLVESCVTASTSKTTSIPCNHEWKPVPLLFTTVYDCKHCGDPKPLKSEQE